jgi:hypothetical protein
LSGNFRATFLAVALPRAIAKWFQRYRFAPYRPMGERGGAPIFPL